MNEFANKKIDKKWGNEILLANNELYCGKFLILNKDHRCSLHFHKLKDETFYFHYGDVLLEWIVGSTLNKYRMKAGTSIRIKPNTIHRFSGISKRSLIIEISTNHKEDDSYRTTESEYIKNGSKEWRNEPLWQF